MFKGKDSIPESEEVIIQFEKSLKEYMGKPSKITQMAFVNWFANVIHFKGEVIAVMIVEETPEYKDPIVRMNRITMGDKIYFGFYTSGEALSASDLGLDADYVKLPLKDVVEMTLADKDIAGLIINPSQGRDAFIPSEMIRQCYDAVKGYKGPIIQ